MIFIFVCFGVHTQQCSDLLRALCSEISPSEAQGIILDAWDQTPVGHVLGQCPIHCTVSLALRLLLRVRRKDNPVAYYACLVKYLVVPNALSAILAA